MANTLTFTTDNGITTDSIIYTGGCRLLTDSESGALDMINRDQVHWHIDTWHNYFRFVRIDYSTGTAVATVPVEYRSNGYWYATKVYNAVWNDIADFITIPDEDIVEPGYCYAMDESEHYHKTSDYMQQSFVAIESDTYGTGLGADPDDKTNKLHSAAAGFVLVYVDKEYETGTPLTCTKDGYLTEISYEDKVNNPHMVIAVYWKPEAAETWGTAERIIKVNGRHWIRVK